MCDDRCKFCLALEEGTFICIEKWEITIESWVQAPCIAPEVKELVDISTVERVRNIENAKLKKALEFQLSSNMNRYFQLKRGAEIIRKLIAGEQAAVKEAEHFLREVKV